VRHSLYEGKLGELKTKNSRRDLLLPEALLDRLKALGDGEYVFHARNGSPINPKNASRRYLLPVLRELGIALGGWHDFRHTFATLMLKEYALKAVSLALGHANTKVTTETYQHIDNPEVNAPRTGMAAKLLSNATRCDQKGDSRESKYLT
jgi:integrase